MSHIDLYIHKLVATSDTSDMCSLNCSCLTQKNIKKLGVNKSLTIK